MKTMFISSHAGPQASRKQTRDVVDSGGEDEFENISNLFVTKRTQGIIR